MKLLFLVSSLEGGGAERVAVLLCNAFAERGYAVCLMPTYSGRGGCSYPPDDTVEVDHLADHVNGATGRLARLRALRRKIRGMRPDAIVSFLPHVNVAAVLAAAGTGVPVIACERIHPPLLPLGAAARLARDLAYRRAAVLCAQTGRTGNWMRRRYPRARVEVIPNPVVLPLPTAAPRLDPDEVLGTARRCLLSVGRLDPQKRHDLLIAGFARIAAEVPDCDLVILGEGAERAALADRAAAEGVAGRVHLPGFAGNLAAWYARADAFALASAFEGFPNALLEAMAHDLPCVAFDIDAGPREITDAGRRALLLPDDAHADRLAEALRRLLTNRAEREALARKAGEVREVFRLDRVLDLWDGLFASVAAGGGRGPAR